MTLLQLYAFDGLYLAILVVVALLTCATARRIAGAVAGGLAFAAAALGIIALGERAGLWHIVIIWKPFYMVLMVIGFAECAFIYLITWRIVRRFGGRGLVAAAIVAAVIGPPRDYSYMARFPEWGTYGTGPATIFAVAGTYALMVLLGHGVMRLVAGPARADRLAPPVGEGDARAGIKRAEYRVNSTEFAVPSATCRRATKTNAAL